MYGFSVHTVVLLGINVLLSTHNSESKPWEIERCTEGVLQEDVDLEEGTCAKLYLSNQTEPFVIPTGSQYPREKWNALIYKSKEVKCIEVSKGRIIRLCHLNAKTTFKQMKCRTSGYQIENEGQYWDKTAQSILGIDCGKKGFEEDKCNETCETVPELVDRRQCATLFVGDECSTCNFNSIPLYANQLYNRITSNLSTIMSIQLRNSNCSVSAAYIDQDDSTVKHYTFQDQSYFTDIHRKNMKYEFQSFYCKCPDDLVDDNIVIQESTHPKSKTPFILIVGLGTILVLLVTSVTLLIVQHFYFKRISEKKLYAALQNLNPELVIPRDRVTFDCEIGKGRYGIVYKGYIRASSKSNPDLEDSGFIDDGSFTLVAVAIKQIKSRSIDYAYLNSLAGEIHILSRLEKHLNVVAMFGACTDNPVDNESGSGLLLIMEFCEHKSLEHFLRKYRKQFRGDKFAPGYLNEYLRCDPESKPGDIAYKQLEEHVFDQLNFHQLVKWSSQIASGMEHLSKSKILHLDLAARNILLDQSLLAKIGDFGLSKMMEDSSNYYTRSIGKDLAVLTMPPEALAKYEFSLKTDVWSFGVCLWEILSLGDVPYKDCEIKSEKDLKCQLDSGFRLPKPEMCPDDLYQIMHECWKQDPRERPNFSTLKDFFECYKLLKD